MPLANRVATIWRDPVWSKVIAAAIIAIIGSLATILIPWARARVASCYQIVSGFVMAHPQLLQWLFMAATLIVLLLYAQRCRRKVKDLESQPVILLDKAASPNISNWDYTGAWSSNGDELDITNSDSGGILKWGKEWKDYDFNFDFKIINARAAWIVRAQGNSHYIMVQCDTDLIRPHTRTAPVLPQDPDRGFRVLGYHPHGVLLKEWNRVKTQVRGDCVRVFINGQLAFEHLRIFQGLSSGTVGFRCSGPERALFKNIEVVRKARSDF